jgi:hypothetical protein
VSRQKDRAKIWESRNLQKTQISAKPFFSHCGSRVSPKPRSVAETAENIFFRKRISTVPLKTEKNWDKEEIFFHLYAGGQRIHSLKNQEN